ncbi:MAG TPA: TetR/AcrR family transcriptional regulator [Gemmataceae bacterium]|nr:TetR/AcrR family transcriptional regulator [Gemmataceae bacterium]
MNPRPYRLHQRKAAAEETRTRILTAVRELLMVRGGFTGFTIDAVARQAGVARMTVYYQFGSKVGLLEALCDFLAVRGGIEQLGGVFEKAEALDALAEFIALFARFWDSDRLVIRRLGCLSALDPELEEVLRGRAERRRQGARAIVGRLIEEHGRPLPEAFHEAVDLVYTLTSFETFDTLAGATRSPVEVAPLVQRLLRAALGLERY